MAGNTQVPQYITFGLCFIEVFWIFIYFSSLFKGMRRDVFPYKGMLSALTRIAHEEGIREMHR